ncbi:MAG: HEAT repeat domain-containing protein [Myxococcaceae bacterium]
MASDPFKEDKKELLAKDPDTFVNAVAHLLLQRRPELTAEVKKHEARLVKVALTASPQPKKRIAAVKALQALKSAELPKLSALLTERSTELVQTAAIALGGTVTSPDGVAALIKKYETAGDWSPQHDAIKALRYFDDPRVVPTFLKALGHEQNAVRVMALQGLAMRKAPEGVPHFLAGLGSSSPGVLITSARALYELDTPEARKAVSDAKAYARALKLAKDEIQGRFAVRALPWFRAKSVEADLLALALKSQDAEVVGAATEGLVLRGSQSALGPLAKKAVTSDDPGYYGGTLVQLLHGLAFKFDPDVKAVGAMLTALGAAKSGVLEEIAGQSEQQRYRLDRAEGAELEHLVAWRKALARAKKNKAGIVALLEEP